MKGKEGVKIDPVAGSYSKIPLEKDVVVCKDCGKIIKTERVAG